MNRPQISLLIVLALVLILATASTTYANHTHVLYSGQARLITHTNPESCIHPDRLNICWNQRTILLVETSDARASGTITLDYDTFAARLPAYQRMAGTFRIENAGGAWQGRLAGASGKDGVITLTGYGKGSERYSGLLIRWQIKPAVFNRMAVLGLDGSILKAGAHPAKR
jgi:hypothetical protein